MDGARAEQALLFSAGEALARATMRAMEPEKRRPSSAGSGM